MANPLTHHSRPEQKVDAEFDQKVDQKVDAELQDYLSQLPSCEPWLNNNAEARASVERGLQQAAEGQGVYLGSFAEFADIEIED